MDFIISSTGYSGTHYITEVLSKCGLYVGHEEIFTPNSDFYLGNFKLLPKRNKNEVAWESFLFLDEIPKSIKIFHMIRDPIKVINSFMRVKFFEKGYEHRLWAEKHPNYPKELLFGEPIEKAMKWYYYINEIIEKAKPMVRFMIEYVDELFLQSFLSFHFNIDHTTEFYEDILRKTSKTMNTTETQHIDFQEWTWETLPELNIKTQLFQMAKDYNYV